MRLLSLILSLVFICLLVGAFFLYLGLDEYLSSYLTSHLGTKTRVEGISITSHTLRLKNVRLSSPGSLPHAFTARAITFQAPLSAYIKQTIHLDALTIEDSNIGIELFNTSGSSNNWVQILNNFPRTTTSSRRFIIDRLTLSSTQFTVLKSNGKPIVVPPLPHLEFRNLGHERPLTAGEIGRLLFQSILTILTKEATLAKILNNVIELPKVLLKEPPIETFNETIDRVRKRAQKALKDLAPNL